MELDPEKLSPAERYGLLISLIQPRPIAWVSTVSPEGVANLAPFSFFTGITAAPMTVCFCPVRSREGRKKDTLINIEATRQFVVNMVSEDLAKVMNETSADHPYGVSEFETAAVESVPSLRVKPLRVKASPASLECELVQVVTLGDGPLGGSVVIGRVVQVHVADRIWKDGKVCHQDLKPLARLEGAFYAPVRETFELPRPRLERKG
jgi:flavin reductase (DIM6/NTAB) family NADH-FMN oxidoreductase RutF